MKKLLIILMTLTVALFLASCTTSDVTGDETVDTGDAAAELALAECLTESGAKFYGAYWCPQCEDQKAMFGSAIDAAPYVECTEFEAECNAAGITGYPTWIFGDGTVVQGSQSFEALASYSGCEY